MYKFNFLQKINLEKQETSKKSKFITMIFLASVTAQILLLGLLFLKSLSVNSYKLEADDEKEKYIKQTNDFRKKDFFEYKKLTHIYNVQIARRQLSYLFKSFETSLDTTMIIERFTLEELDFRIHLISRTDGSKSKLMSEINQLRSDVGESLVEGNYILKSSDITLDKGPDLRSKEKNSDETKYWSFSFSIKIKKNAVKKVVKKKDNNLPDVKI